MKSEKFVTLLDTTAVTFLTLYIEACEAVGGDYCINLDELKSKYEDNKVPRQYLNFKDIKKGCDVLTHMNARSKEFDGNIEIWFSLLNEIELLNILTERFFDEELRRKKIPYRIRSKKLLKLQIDFDYDREIFGYWKSMKSKMEELNINLQTPEGPESSRDALIDIVNIAKVIAKHVNFTSVDLYIYATGLFLHSDEIFTHDEEMEAIISRIRNDPEWSSIKSAIQSDLIINFPPFKEEYDINKEINFPASGKEEFKRLMGESKKPFRV